MIFFILFITKIYSCIGVIINCDKIELISDSNITNCNGIYILSDFELNVPIFRNQNGSIFFRKKQWVCEPNQFPTETSVKLNQAPVLNGGEQRFYEQEWFVSNEYIDMILKCITDHSSNIGINKFSIFKDDVNKYPSSGIIFLTVLIAGLLTWIIMSIVKIIIKRVDQKRNKRQMAMILEQNIEISNKIIKQFVKDEHSKLYKSAEFNSGDLDYAEQVREERKKFRSSVKSDRMNRKSEKEPSIISQSGSNVNINY